MRDYDPTTGRYIQADPLGLVDGASIYGYALQNPGRYVDPTGETALGQAIKKGVEKAVEWCKANVRVQGPDGKFFKHGHGRVFQLLLKKAGKKGPSSDWTTTNTLEVKVKSFTVIAGSMKFTFL